MRMRNAKNIIISVFIILLKSTLAASFLHFVAMPSNVIVLRLDEWSKRLNENDGQEPHLMLKEDLQSDIS